MMRLTRTSVEESMNIIRSLELPSQANGGLLERPFKDDARVVQPFKLTVGSKVNAADITDDPSTKSGYKADRHLNRRSNLPIIFIDGEGANVGERTHKGVVHRLQNYSLLSAVGEDGLYRRIIGENGTGRLSTKQCLDFLLDLPSNARKCSFGFTYDTYQILYDLPEKQMLRLLDRHGRRAIRWGHYYITYTPNKVFSVTRLRKKNDKSTPRQSCFIWDIRGFSQGSFTSALIMWGIATKEELITMQAMKDKRGDFAGIDDEQIEYNRSEGLYGCRLLKAIIDACKELGLSLTRYDGAGAIAAAMLRKHSIQTYIHQKEPLPNDVILRAYFGGRFDYCQLGNIGNAIEYDIHSAYPNIARKVPCLAHSSWRKESVYIPTNNSLWHVRWKLDNCLWAPFPWRDRSGDPHYYSSGEGWYYGSEVQSSLLLYPSIEVLEGFSLVTSCDHLPFKFLESYYYQRAELKANGKLGAQLAIKLGINSVYGKTAQTKTGLDQNGIPIIPPNQCMLWAGMMTAGTRAMLLDAIRLNPNGAKVLATDAVVTTSRLDLPLTDQLGDWEAKELTDFVVAGNGLYQSADGKAKVGTRGYAAKNVNWKNVRAGFKAGIIPFNVIVPDTVFYNSRDASETHDYTLRCSWTNKPKTMTVRVPSSKELREDGMLWTKNCPTNELSYPADVDPNRLRVDHWEDTEYAD